MENQQGQITKMAISEFRVAVIGGGPGGYAAAFLAADLGMKVTLIDPEIIPAASASIAAAFHPSAAACRQAA